MQRKSDKRVAKTSVYPIPAGPREKTSRIRTSWGEIVARCLPAQSGSLVPPNVRVALISCGMDELVAYKQWEGKHKDEKLRRIQVVL